MDFEMEITLDYLSESSVTTRQEGHSKRVGNVMTESEIGVMRGPQAEK